jgi:hypothetical protein
VSIKAFGGSASVASASASPCDLDPCDPQCVHWVDDGHDVDGGDALTMDDAGGISLTPQDGGTGNWDAAGSCTGLQCRVAPCSGDHTRTQVTGQVYDPAGKNPIPNVVVFVPNAALDPIVDGVSCERCTAGSGQPIVSALTDYTGRFTLRGVPSGADVPIVIQSGKWRRALTLPYVDSCASNDANLLKGTDGLPLLRFPKNRTEGNIPRIGFASGSADPFQCVLSKMGLDTSVATGEFSSATDGAGALKPQRVHYYNSYSSSGDTLATDHGGPGDSAALLWGSLDRLKKYDAVILACEGSEYAKNTAHYDNVVQYANLGGRVFATHYSYVWLQFAAAASQWPQVTYAWNHQSFPADPMTASIERSFAKGETFAQWLSYVGASTTLGQLPLHEARHDYDYVDSSRATRWMTAWSDDVAGTRPPAGAGNTCSATSPCGAGLACTSPYGYCADNSTCSTSADCGTRTRTCWRSSQCWGPHTDCVGGQCKVASYALGVCDAGWCPDNTGCTVDADCGTRTRSCTWDSDCWGASTYCSSGQCKVRQYVLGICDVVGDRCAATSCATDAGCPSGHVCVSGACARTHDMEPLMTFNVPVGAASDAQCGRVVFSDFHVSANALVSSWGGTFPGNCKTGDLSAQEKALEFMLFDLTSCISPDWRPPSVPPYQYPIAVTRDYESTCPSGYRPVWRFFDWKTNTPSDTKILFQAQTGDTLALAQAMSPVTVASVSGAPITVWTGVDVSSKIAPTPSGTVLRITIVLFPSSDGMSTPTLNGWRQAYDCVEKE